MATLELDRASSLVVAISINNLGKRDLVLDEEGRPSNFHSHDNMPRVIRILQAGEPRERYAVFQEQIIDGECTVVR